MGRFYNKHTVLAGSVSPGLDPPRVAGSFPDSPPCKYVCYRTLGTRLGGHLIEGGTKGGSDFGSRFT